MSDFDFYRRGDSIYVNRLAHVFDCIASSVDRVTYFGRVVPADDVSALEPISSSNFETVNLRTLKRNPLVDAPRIIRTMWQHKHECDVFVLKLGNLHAFLAFWVLKAARSRVICYAINDLELPNRYKSALSLKRLAFHVFTLITKAMYTHADGRLALTPTIARRYLCKPKEFCVYVETSLAESGLNDCRVGDAASQPTVVLSVGRLVPYKGHDVLIRAFQGLRGEGLDLRLIIAGEGHWRPYLESLVSELGLEQHVSFLGHVPNGPRLWRVYRQAHIFVLPSLSEALGLVIIEAMANGLPVVASAVGGIPDVVVNGVNGLLVRPGDADELSRAIKRLVEDNLLRDRIIRGGFETAKRYTAEKQTSVLIEYVMRVYRSGCSIRSEAGG